MKPDVQSIDPTRRNDSGGILEGWNWAMTMKTLSGAENGSCRLAPFTRVELTLKLEPLIAAKAKENQVARKGKQSGATCQNSDKLKPVDTKKELAKLSGLSHDTIAKDALKHPNGAKWSDGKIGEHVGVSQRMVTKYRQELTPTQKDSESPTREGRDGRTTNTANIGRRAAAAPEHDDDPETPTPARTSADSETFGVTQSAKTLRSWSGRRRKNGKEQAQAERTLKQLQKNLLKVTRVKPATRSARPSA